MKTKELIGRLLACDPEAEVIFGPFEDGRFSGYERALTKLRESQADCQTREGKGSRYLEMPKTGKFKVVIVS